LFGGSTQGFAVAKVKVLGPMLQGGVAKVLNVSRREANTIA